MTMPWACHLVGQGRRSKEVDSDSTVDLIAATPDIWTAEKFHSHNQSQTISTAIPSILVIGGFFFVVAGPNQRSAPSVIPAFPHFVRISPRVVLSIPMTSHKRGVILIGDAGVGKSSLLAVRNGFKPFIGKYPPYFSYGSFEQLVTNSDSGWREGVPVKASRTTRTTLKRRGLKIIRQTQIHVHNLNPGVTCTTLDSYCCHPVTTVVLCFSIGDERSFENIKYKVNWASLNNPLGLQITRANATVRSVVPHDSALPPRCSNVAPWHEERPTRPCPPFWSTGNQ